MKNDLNASDPVGFPLFAGLELSEANGVVPMTKQEVRAEHFRQAEANFRLSGLDASGNAHYQAMKARIISGEIEADDAIQETIDYYKALIKARASGISVTD